MKILIVDDEENIRQSIQRLFALEGLDSVTAADGQAAQGYLTSDSFDALVVDLKMPRMNGQELIEWMRAEGLRTPVLMISAFGEIDDAVRALKTGADDYLIKPFNPTELIHRVRSLISARKSEDLLETVARTARTKGRLVGLSAPMRNIQALIDKVAPTSTMVLITGESGTGKEVVAREIHLRSPRCQEPFVPVNIGGVHAELMESELFGHERGSFTGAEARKIGLFELAGRGTLFLDEIGEMPLGLQVKLLRVLQDRKIRRLGGNRDIPIDARIISATNRDLEALVASGAFREDLYYRLNVVRIVVPPLRDRKEDLGALTEAILEKFRNRSGGGPWTVSEQALNLLSQYSFPGNIRELENILERGTIYCEGNRIEAKDIDVPKQRAPGVPAPSSEAPLILDTVEAQTIVAALKAVGGNRTKAAVTLGISRRTLLYKLKRYGIH